MTPYQAERTARLAAGEIYYLAQAVRSDGKGAEFAQGFAASQDEAEAICGDFIGDLESDGIEISYPVALHLESNDDRCTLRFDRVVPVQ